LTLIFIQLITPPFSFSSCLQLLASIYFLFALLHQLLALLLQNPERASAVPRLLGAALLNVLRQTSEEGSLHCAEVGAKDVLEVVKCRLNVRHALQKELHFHWPHSSVLFRAQKHLNVLLAIAAVFEQIFDLEQLKAFGCLDFFFELVECFEQAPRVCEVKRASRDVLELFEREFAVGGYVFEDLDVGSGEFFGACELHIIRLVGHVLHDVCELHLDAGNDTFGGVDSVGDQH